jgi:hypothetical protein
MMMFLINEEYSRMIKLMNFGNFGTKLCALMFCCAVSGIESSDLSELDNRIVKTYAESYVREYGLGQSLGRLHDAMGAGSMGFISMHDLHMEVKSFDKKLLMLETTIWGTESEFLQPEQYLLEPETASLKGLLLLDIIKRYSQLPDTASSIILSKHTKCGLPCYYGESGRGTIRCVTFVPKETMVSALKDVSLQRLQFQKEESSQETVSNS